MLSMVPSLNEFYIWPPDSPRHQVGERTIPKFVPASRSPTQPRRSSLALFATTLASTGPPKMSGAMSRWRGARKLADLSCASGLINEGLKVHTHSERHEKNEPEIYGQRGIEGNSETKGADVVVVVIPDPE